jgi:hypothetical protein
MINYYPDRGPKITSDFVKAAKQLNVQIAHIVCDPPNAKPDDPGGVSFLAITPYLPRAGDHVRLEDGRRCEVKNVTFQVCVERDDEGKASAIVLMPNVTAILLGNA